ncbi:hypothetical protein [Litoribacillus peritrichatus]|uniref:DksA C4-type domain-containing protein n=1 Tax=Litoribacillus peritrichatus TaxID=718191 RepID=A0ABP7MF81_9GAMM
MIMTATQVEELKEVIQFRVELLNELIKENVKTASESNADDGWPIVPAKELSSIEQQVIDNAQREILDLTKTLAWLDTDFGGRCEACGEAIEFEKLKSAPANRSCENCIQR